MPADEAARILQFGLDKWRETRERKEFKSVLFFKNHGYMSGGSIRHPHSQIIGLEDYDYHEDITAQNMEGWLLHEDQGCAHHLSLSLSWFLRVQHRFKPDAPVRSVARPIATSATLCFA